MSEQELEQDKNTGSGVTASKMLLSAREAMGLSQEEVADQLYLTKAYIRYIDEGSFDKLPKPAFIKGYLRSYARTVGLGGDEVVASYDEALQSAEESVQIRGVTEETVGSVAITGPVLQTGLVGLFGVVIVVGMVWWIVSSGKDDDVLHAPQATAPQGTVPQVTVPQEAESVQVEVSKAKRNDFDFVRQNSQTGVAVIDDAEPAGGLTGESEQKRLDASSAVAESPFDASAAPVREGISVERHRDAGVNYITVDANGFDEVEAIFTDDCWLEVEDANGDSIYGDLNKSGDILRIYGAAPFKLLIGRAAALSLTFNGDDINLALYTAEDETAKVTLAR